MATGSVYKRSDFVKDYCCDAFEKKHIEESAEFFCKTCTKFFCGKCINLHSQLYEKHITFERVDMNKWPLSKKTEDFLQICEIHKDKKLKMFCQDHNQLCCTYCVLLSHRQCKEVKLLSNAVKSHSTDLQQLALQLNPDNVITLKGKSKHDVHMSSDSDQTCKITGICCLPSGQIVVADQLNGRVKLLDQQYNVVSHCNVSGDLCDICHITSNDMAVTVKDDQTSSVQFISVRHGKLVNNRKFQLQHDICGMAHHQGTLYITSETALYHYNLNGTLVKKMYEDVSAVSTVFKCAVSPTGDRIYVTNPIENTLLTLSSDGTLISTFRNPNLCSPWCVHVTPAGQVLVSWFYSFTIIQVDMEGKRKLATLATYTDVVGFPLSVCYNSNRNSIIVGMRDKSKILVLKAQ